MRVISAIENCLQPTCLALGNFDGIHLGHRTVIESLRCSPKTVCSKTVVSFDPHPQAFFKREAKPLLTLLPEKVQLLESLGVDQLVLLPFDEDLAALSPEDFVYKILVEQLQAQSISVGFNFGFGHRRSGTVDNLKDIAAQYGIPVSIVPPCTLEGKQVSSSDIRHALMVGEVLWANQLLGRSYSLTGTVVRGQQLGRTLGFPTANLNISSQKFIPRDGVYRVTVDSVALDQVYLGVMNIGMRPTVQGLQRTLEVHVLDWSGDLYGQAVTVHLEQFLRPEQKFESLDALKDQIQRDCSAARSP